MIICGQIKERRAQDDNVISDFQADKSVNTSMLVAGVPSIQVDIASVQDSVRKAGQEDW